MKSEVSGTFRFRATSQASATSPNAEMKGA